MGLKRKEAPVGSSAEAFAAIPEARRFSPRFPLTEWEDVILLDAPLPLGVPEDATMFDLIVRGGRVIDPSQELDAVTDVGIVGPRVMAIGTDLVGQGVRGEVIDASGLLVTPPAGLTCTPMCTGASRRSASRPTPIAMLRGVTTAVDAGWLRRLDLPGFKRYVIDLATTRVKAMLHLSAIGMARDDTFGAEAIGELEDLRWPTSTRRSTSRVPTPTPSPASRSGSAASTSATTPTAPARCCGAPARSQTRSASR